MKEGYECGYRFSMVHENDINSLHKSHLINELRAFLFEIRANFILKRKPPGEEDVRIDSETFDAVTYEHEDEKDDLLLLSYTVAYRLEEYWMTQDEIDSFIEAAVAFARSKAAEPGHASLSLIPVAVHLDVCTVQQEGERLDAAMERAIRAGNLVPLYLWPQPTAVERRRMTGKLMNFLRGLDRVRVQDGDQGLRLMRECYICQQGPKVGDQISVLSCKHAFHSHCVVRLLEEVNVCPLCQSPAYDRRITSGRVFELRRG